MAIILKKKLTRILIKTVASLILLLSVLWLSSPKLIAWTIKSQLPDDWKLDNIIVAYPATAGVEIIDVTLSTKNQKVKLESLFFPFFSDQSIQIQQLSIELQQAGSKQNNQAALESPIPVISAYSVDIKNINITHEDFEINGAVMFTPKAGQFIGEFKVQGKVIAAEANILGFDGTEPLQFSSKLGDQQFFTLLYFWQEKNLPQKIKIIGNMQQQLWQLIRHSNYISIPDSFRLSDPALGFNLTLSWPQWPISEADLLNFKFAGEVQLEFSEAQFAQWLIQKNSILLKSSSDKKIQISTTEKIKITTPQFSTVIENSVLDKAIVTMQKSGITVENMGVLNATYQNHHIEIKKTQLSYDFVAEVFKSSNDVTLNISPFSLSDKVQSIDNIIMNSHAEFKFDASKLEIKLTANAINLPKKINIQDWALSNTKLNIQPIAALLDVTDRAFSKSNLSTQIVGSFDSTIAQSSTVNSLEVINHCEFKTDLFELELQCNSFPEIEQHNNIESSMHYNVQTQAFQATATANNVKLKRWPVFGVVNKDLFVAEGTTSFFLKINSLLPELMEIDVEHLLEMLTPESRLSIDNMELVYGGLTAAAVNLDINTDKQNKITLEISAAALKLASGINITDIKLQLAGVDKQSINLTKQQVSQLAAEFSIFDGKIHFTSEDFSLFSESYRVDTRIAQLNLENLLEWIDIENLTGTGTLSGEFPLQIDAQGLTILDGELASEVPGYVRYSDNNPSESNIAMDALKNFHYQQLSVGIKKLQLFYKQQGSFEIPVRIVGRNPKSQFDNTFAINPLIQGVIPEQTWSQLITGDLQKQLLEK